MFDTLVVIFWISITIVVYVYLGYPVVVWILGQMFGRAPRKAAIEPKVSILVAAFNEAAVIQEKIRNSLAIDYPAERLEVVIASDGSTDDTVERGAALADGKHVRLIPYPINRGKIMVLNETVPQLRGEIIIFSDATSKLAPSAVRLVVSHFADPEVGAVSASYGVHKTDQASLGAQEGMYWKYETWLKAQESALGAVLGAHGSMYAIRTELYPFPGKNTINDDFVIPLRILQKGYRVTYEPAAAAYEEAQEMEGFQRRVRIMTGNMQQLREVLPLMRPLRLTPLFCMLSHKVGRLLVPPAMILSVLTNLALLQKPAYAWLGLFQSLFYLTALAGLSRMRLPKILRLPYYFCMINAAVVPAMWNAFVRGRLAWK
jgi:cellulose synthase/poly-beta-1,6-N-acetylglucosamine synthase-like glycosyltransferase